MAERRQDAEAAKAGQDSPARLASGETRGNMQRPARAALEYQGFILDSVAETGSRRAGGDWRGARGNLDRSYPSKPWRWKV